MNGFLKHRATYILNELEEDKIHGSRHSPSFLRREKTQRETRMVGPSRPQIVLFGSSIVQMSFGHGGWGAILSEVYARKADIILRGYYGWNSTRALEVVDKVFPKDAAVQPSLVVVYFGGNDSMAPHPSGLGPHVPLNEYVDNMKKIALHLQSLSDSTRIIFLTCPPVNEAKVRQNQSFHASPYLSEVIRTNELCKTYSDACVELCKELGLQVVDLFSTLQKADDWETVCFTDGIHLSGQGSKLVAAEILRVVKEAEWRPSLHWKSMPTEFSEDSPYDLVSADGKTTVNSAEWTYFWEEQWD